MRPILRILHIGLVFTLSTLLLFSLAYAVKLLRSDFQLQLQVEAQPENPLEINKPIPQDIVSLGLT